MTETRRWLTVFLGWLAFELMVWSQQVARLSLQVCPGPTAEERTARIAEFDLACRESLDKAAQARRGVMRAMEWWSE